MYYSTSRNIKKEDEYLQNSFLVVVQKAQNCKLLSYLFIKQTVSLFFDFSTGGI
jgi:hypothetical protein